MDTVSTQSDCRETIERIITVLNEFCENRTLLLEEHILDSLINWLTDWADDFEAADDPHAKQTLFIQFTDDAATRLHQHRVKTKGWKAVAFTQPDIEIHPKRRDELSRVATRISRLGMTLLSA